MTKTTRVDGDVYEALLQLQEKNGDHSISQTVRRLLEKQPAPAGPGESARYRAALERIVSGIPAHDDQNGLYVAHFDANGNEIGIQQVDPMAVIGSILGVATEALSVATIRSPSDG